MELSFPETKRLEAGEFLRVLWAEKIISFIRRKNEEKKCINCGSFCGSGGIPDAERMWK